MGQTERVSKAIAKTFSKIGFKKKSKKIPKVKPKWEEIFSSFGDGLIIVDPTLTIIGMNPSAETITDASAETCVGHVLEDAFPANSDLFVQAYAAFGKGIPVTFREMPWHHRGRENATLDLSITPLLSDEGRHDGWILVLRDVTPVKKLEEEIRKADRLAMMGTIAAGLAHEIKNPLGGIKGAAQLLLRETLSEDSKECLQIVVRETERVDRLINELLTFAKPQNLISEPLNLNELIHSILTLEREFIEKNKIKVVREFDPSLPAVLGNSDQLKQVLLNFIMNAVDAVRDAKRGDRGKILIRTRMMTNFKIKGEKGRPWHMAAVDIQDNGTGMSPETIEKIFTPFFTTKEKGYGLGLAVSQRIVNEHGGTIHLTSTVGEGTSFQILLRSAL